MYRHSRATGILVCPRQRQYLLDATRQAIQDQLDTAFGYHLLQLGLG
ncbi:MAG: hypothetical protein R3E50_10765 [Halioglobus sp.]